LLIIRIIFNNKYIGEHLLSFTMKITLEGKEIEISAGELGLVHRVNSLAKSEFQLIVADKVTGNIYQRNLDWEWAGGNLYDVIGYLRPELVTTKGLLHLRVHIKEKFYDEIKDCRFVKGVVIYDAELRQPILPNEK